MLRLLPFALACLCSLPLLAADPSAPTTQSDPAAAPPAGWIDATPTPYGPVMMQQASPPPYRDYQMNRILTPDEKKALDATGHADDHPHGANGCARGGEPFRRQIQGQTRHQFRRSGRIDDAACQPGQPEIRRQEPDVERLPRRAERRRGAAHRSVQLLRYRRRARHAAHHPRNGGIHALPHHRDGRCRQEHLGDDAGLGRDRNQPGRQAHEHHPRTARRARWPSATSSTA